MLASVEILHLWPRAFTSLLLALEAVIGAQSLERINRPLLLLGLKRGRLSLKILQEERCELDGLILTCEPKEEHSLYFGNFSF